MVALACMVALTSACDLSTGPAGDVADVRGSWHYTGDQAAPALTLDGTLVISSQAGDAIGGQASWIASDGVGGTTVGGGAVSGRVIEQSDVDFDVLLPAGARRHVGRLVADTMEGNWVQLATGASGTFRAVRDDTP